MHLDCYLGEYLYPMMVMRRFSVAETALRLGISRSYFYRILTGTAGVRPRLAIAMEYVLGAKGDVVLAAVAARGLDRAREAEKRRLAKLSRNLRARPCHADVAALCRLGSQWCHVCRDWTCGDNSNPAKPVPRPHPKPVRLRPSKGKQLSLLDAGGKTEGG